MTLKFKLKMYHSYSSSKNGWEFKLLERGVKETADFSVKLNLYFTDPNLR